VEFGVIESSGDLGLTIHSGSRQLGQKICNYWQNIANAGDPELFKQHLEAGIKEIRAATKNRKEIPNRIEALRKELADRFKGKGYLEGKLLIGYLTDMIFAQLYASLNRQTIGEIIIDIFGGGRFVEPVEPIETIHNYIDFNDFIIRKGSIASYTNQLMIIPFNMEDGLILCEGKSNPEWNFSAPHGAGRPFSRRYAKENINRGEAANRMFEKGIVASVIPVDESRDAYKDPAMIEAAIGPTVKIIDRVRPILGLKEGVEEDA